MLRLTSRARALLGVGLILALAATATSSASTARGSSGVATTPPRGIALPPAPTSPGTYPLAANASAVTLRWYDRSKDEQKFVVYRRNRSGTWQQIYSVPTRNVAD